MCSPRRPSSRTPETACPIQVSVPRFCVFVTSRMVSLLCREYQDAVDDQQDDGDGHQDVEKLALPFDEQAAADEGHAQTVQPVPDDTGKQDDVKRQEHRAGGQVDKAVPTGLAAEKLAQRDHVQQQVEHQAKPGNPIEHEPPVAHIALEGEEPAADVSPARARLLPGICLALAWIIRGCHASSTPTGSLGLSPSSLRMRFAVASRRRSMILPPGSTSDGQTAVHSIATWQRQSPLSLSTSSQMRCLVSSGMSGRWMMRWAAASGAGPR